MMLKHQHTKYDDMTYASYLDVKVCMLSRCKDRHVGWVCAPRNMFLTHIFVLDFVHLLKFLYQICCIAYMQVVCFVAKATMVMIRK